MDQRGGGSKQPGRGLRPALLALVLCLAAAAPAMAQTTTPAPSPNPSVPPPTGPPVVITGTLSNGSAGGAIPAGLQVLAVQFDAANNELSRHSAPLGPGGAIRVEGFRAQDGARYILSVAYLGVTYSTEAIPPAAASLKIFETTADETVIIVPTDTMTVIQGRDDTYDILQELSIRNTSDRTYIGNPPEGGSPNAPQQVLQLPVALQAVNFTPVSGISKQGLSNSLVGVATGDPVPPGDTVVSYTYQEQVPRRSGWPMTRAVVYPTGQVNVLVGPGLDLVEFGLNFKETLNIGGKQYRHFQSGLRSPGSSVAAQIGPVLSAGSTGLLWALGVSLALVLIVGLGVPRLLRRRSGPSGAVMTTDRERLVEEIAELDETWEGGGLGEGEYRKTRARLKRRLADLTAELAGEQVVRPASLPADRKAAATRPTPPATRPTPPATRPTPPATRPTPPATRPTPPATRPTPPATRPSVQTKTLGSPAGSPEPESPAPEPGAADLTVRQSGAPKPEGPAPAGPEAP